MNRFIGNVSTTMVGNVFLLFLLHNRQFRELFLEQEYGKFELDDGGSGSRYGRGWGDVDGVERGTESPVSCKYGEVTKGVVTSGLMKK